MLRTLGGDSYAACVVRIGLTFEDTFDRLELPTHFLYHLLRRTAHRVHRQTAEEERHHRADEDTYQHDRVHQVDVIRIHEIYQTCFRRLYPVRQRFACTDERYLDLFDIRCQERQRREGGTTDSKTFSGRSRGVAEGIECIRALTNLCRQTTHLCVTAGVVGDRTVSVRSQGDSQGREHTYRRDTDTVQTHTQVRRAELYMEAVRAEIR